MACKVTPIGTKYIMRIYMCVNTMRMASGQKTLGQFWDISKFVRCQSVARGLLSPTMPSMHSSFSIPKLSYHTCESLVYTIHKYRMMHGLATDR